MEVRDVITMTTDEIERNGLPILSPEDTEALSPFGFAEYLLRLLIADRFDEHAMSRARSLSHCRERWALGVPVFVAAQTYAMRWGEKLDTPDALWDETARDWADDIVQKHSQHQSMTG